MASLVLSDGTTFAGESFGAAVDSDGEVVFNTGMAGYPESLTDPSYRGQILVFTYPLIGNYGVPSEELNEWGFSKNFESEEIHVRGVIVSQESRDYSHQAAVSSLHNWLEHHSIPGITGVDTRALTKKLREHGVMLGRIRQEIEGIKEIEEIEDPNLVNLVAEVSCKEIAIYEPEDATKETPTVIAYDCGMKRNIIRSFLQRGIRVIRVPWDFDLASFDGQYDAVFISNGPGDPKMCTKTIENIRWAIDHNILTFGICLGNQLMALAIGGDTYKLKYGHRGANQPCIEVNSEPSFALLELRTGRQMTVPACRTGRDSGHVASLSPMSESRRPNRCIITSQNHGFAVDGTKLPKGWNVWFTNANDDTVEGIRHESGKFFAVQFHPEATPGPEDANYLFDRFQEMLEQK